MGWKSVRGAVLQTEVDIHDGQDVQKLALVLVQALDLNIKDEVGVQSDALMLLDDFAELLLLLALDLIEAGDKILVDHGLELAQTIQIGEEIAADLLGNESGELGVAQTQPAAGGDAVGLILEPLREHLIPAPEHIVLQDLAVDLGHAVDIAAHIDGQVRHVRHIVLNDIKTGMLGAELAVDAADDVCDLRYHAAQQIQRPLLQCLAHDGVVGVGEGLLSDGKGLLEVHALAHEQTDQLGDGHGGMGVIELDGVEVSKAAQVAVVVQLAYTQHILKGCRGEQVLLLDPQALALPSGVVGVQDAGDILGFVFLIQRPHVVLIVERTEVQLVLGFALPQAQGIHIVGAIADDGHIIGHSQNGLVGKMHLHGVVVPAVRPRIAELGPVIGGFDLAAVLIKGLLEQTETVAKTIAGQRKIAACGRIQEAGGQPAQTAVAQSVVLDLLQTGKIHAPLGKELAHLVQDAQIVQVAVDQSADQILSREVVGLPLGLASLFLLRLQLSLMAIMTAVPSAS